MLVKLMRKIYKDQKGITGLETAIILIAFVVVAAVFAYTVLSAGLFSTEKSKEAVYSGLEETQSTIEISGGVIADNMTALDEMDYPLGWTSVDADADASRVAEASLGSQGGIGAVKYTVDNAAGLADGTVVGWKLISPVAVAIGDTISLWIKGTATQVVNFGLDDDTTFNADIEEFADYTLTGSYVNQTYTATAAGTVQSIGVLAGTGNLDDLDEVELDNIMVIHGGTQGQDYYTSVLDDCDYPLGWEAGTNMTAARNTSPYNGTGCMTLTATGSPADNEILAYKQIGGGDTAGALDYDIATGDKITLWVKSTYTASAPAITFGTDDDTTFNADLEEQNITTTTSWAKSTLTIASDRTGADGITTIGILDNGGSTITAADSDVVFIDLIETENYADRLMVTLQTVLGGEPINFKNTLDGDNDGLLSDETTKTHEVVVTYSDAYQTFNDIAWNVKEVGEGDDDNMLENNEKFLMTIDLAQVNMQAEVDTTETRSERPERKRTFTLEIKPPKGAVLTIERTMPDMLHDIDNLN